MIMQTIADYLDRTESDTPFKGSASIPAPILTSEFQYMLTTFISEEYGDYRLRFKFEKLVDAALTVAIQTACDNVYLVHSYTYQHLYDTTVAQYNPIENYDMKEHEKINNSGTDTTSRDVGSHTDTTNIGEVTNTDIYGQDHTASNRTDNKAPFESQTYKNYTQSIASDTRDSRTDRHTQSQQSNSMTIGGHHDTDKLQHGHEIERDLTRHGNIGVTSTMELLEQERRISAMNLVRIVANDIIHAICICYMGGGY